MNRQELISINFSENISIHRVERDISNNSIYCTKLGFITIKALTGIKEKSKEKMFLAIRYRFWETYVSSETWNRERVNRKIGRADGRNEREKGTLWGEGSEFLHGNYRCDVFHARTRLTGEQYFERVIQKQRSASIRQRLSWIAGIGVESLIALHSQWFYFILL